MLCCVNNVVFGKKKVGTCWRKCSESYTNDAYVATCRFNKDEDQFDTKLEYDDYLEQKEDISTFS